MRGVGAQVDLGREGVPGAVIPDIEKGVPFGIKFSDLRRTVDRGPEGGMLIRCFSACLQRRLSRDKQICHGRST